jgi:hypothetical protein
VSDDRTKQSAYAGPVWDHKSQGKAKVSNHVHRQVLPDIDGRRKAARRFRDIASAVAVDLGSADRLTEVQKQLVRRFAAGAVVAEMREAAMARGEALDVTRWVSISNTLIKLAGKLGMTRVPRDIADTTTLADILREGRS